MKALARADRCWLVCARVCAGDVSIARSAGRLSGGFSHWTSITAGGVTEAMVSAITHDGPEAEKTNAIMDKIDVRHTRPCLLTTCLPDHFCR